MKKNILIALGILLAVVIIALAGCGLYLIKINTPKGCVSLQNYNYPPAFAIMEDTAYDFSGPEITKIVNLAQSENSELSNHYRGSLTPLMFEFFVEILI